MITTILSRLRLWQARLSKPSQMHNRQPLYKLPAVDLCFPQYEMDTSSFGTTQAYGPPSGQKLRHKVILPEISITERGGRYQKLCTCSTHRGPATLNYGS